MVARLPPIKSEQGLLNSAAPTARLAVFGPPPLIEGEDPAAYNELLAYISAAVKPTDILDDILVRDIVDLEWGILRLRRSLANLMSAKARSQLKETLHGLLAEGADDLAEKWAQQKPDAIKRVNRILASVGKTIDMVVAENIPTYLHIVVRIEELIAMAEARRNAILREVDRRRATVAQRLRLTIDQIEGTEYQVVEKCPKSD